MATAKTMLCDVQNRSSLVDTRGPNVDKNAFSEAGSANIDEQDTGNRDKFENNRFSDITKTEGKSKELERDEDVHRVTEENVNVGTLETDVSAQTDGKANTLAEALRKCQINDAGSVSQSEVDVSNVTGDGNSLSTATGIGLEHGGSRVERKWDSVSSVQSLRPDLDNWKYIGRYSDLCKKKCQHLFAKSGKRKDLALFFRDMKFYAMEAWCSHMGGPLSKGEIEDYHGKCHVMCPWHGYMFNLTNGKNELGLQTVDEILKHKRDKVTFEVKKYKKNKQLDIMLSYAIFHSASPKRNS